MSVFSLIHNSWNAPNLRIPSNISRITLLMISPCGIKNILVNIFYEKKRLVDRILGIQKAQDTSDCEFLHGFGKSLILDLNKFLILEEELGRIGVFPLRLSFPPNLTVLATLTFAHLLLWLKSKGFYGLSNLGKLRLGRLSVRSLFKGKFQMASTVLTFVSLLAS